MRYPTVPTPRTTTSAAIAYPRRRTVNFSTTVVSWRCGRRSAGAPAQHPHRPRANVRGLRQLRERQLLRLRVHGHVRARRSQRRAGRRSRRRRRARELDALEEARVVVEEQVRPLRWLRPCERELGEADEEGARRGGITRRRE